MTRYQLGDILQRGVSMGKRTTMADIVRTAFRDSGMSIKRLSTAAGTPYASAHAFLTGDRDPQLSTLERWCRVLDLELRPVRQKKRKG